MTSAPDLIPTLVNEYGVFLQDTDGSGTLSRLELAEGLSVLCGHDRSVFARYRGREGVSRVDDHSCFRSLAAFVLNKEQD